MASHDVYPLDDYRSVNRTEPFISMTTLYTLTHSIIL